MKNSWQEEYAALCRELSFSDMIGELLHVALSVEHINWGDNIAHSKVKWKITFLQKEIVARYKNK